LLAIVTCCYPSFELNEIFNLGPEDIRGVPLQANGAVRRLQPEHRPLHSVHQLVPENETGGCPLILFKICYFGLLLPVVVTVILQSSGWPDWVKTDADKETYVRQYEEREGIKLNPDNIKKNPGMRALSKLGLNSFWVGSLSLLGLRKSLVLRLVAIILIISFILSHYQTQQKNLILLSTAGEVRPARHALAEALLHGHGRAVQNAL
jgi:hypothetical protein